MTVAIYKLTASFPASEKFGLTNQLRRASVSVASNMAEGYGRSTKGEYHQFPGHARGSKCEVETQLAISEALGFGSENRQCQRSGRRAVRPLVPDSEVVAPPHCRRFSAEYKLSIIDQADSTAGVGAVGALLCREGLYSPHLATWRQQRKQGEFDALTANKRGRRRSFPAIRDSS